MLILTSCYESQCHCTTEPNPCGMPVTKVFQHQMQLNICHLFKIRFPRFTAKRANAFRIFDSHQQ